MKHALRLKFIDGRKQDPADYDFAITPFVFISKSDPSLLEEYGIARGFGVSWGYWAFAIALYSAKIP